MRILGLVLSFMLIVLIGLSGMSCTAEDLGYTTDVITGSITSLENTHHEIHEGNMFTVLNVTDLGNGAVLDILIVTPDTEKWAHMVWEIEHELEALIQFYQSTTYSDIGTPLPSLNRNGNSSNISTTLAYHTPTITNVGILIGTIQQGSDKKAGGSDREIYEFILQQNCVYLLRITNLTASDNLIFTRLSWYEHANE